MSILGMGLWPMNVLFWKMGVGNFDVDLGGKWKSLTRLSK